MASLTFYELHYSAISAQIMLLFFFRFKKKKKYYKYLILKNLKETFGNVI